MRQTITVWIIFLLLLSGCASSGLVKPVLSPDSYGAIFFGDRLTDVEAAMGEKAQPSSRDMTCDYVRFSSYPGIRFMVENGIITRGEALDNSTPNVFGLGIATPLSEVKLRYPSATIQPHFYDPSGHYIIFNSKDGKHAMIMEELNGKITVIRSGLMPSVEYVEGCL